MKDTITQPAGVAFVRSALDSGTAAPAVVERFFSGQRDQVAGRCDSDRFGSDPAYWLGWTRAEAEQAEDRAYRDGWNAAVVEDFDAQPPDAPNPVREAWYQGFRGGTRHLNTQRNLERARQATAKTADHLEQVDGEWVRQTVDNPDNFIQVPEPLADKVADRMAALKAERQDVSGHRRDGKPLADKVAEQVIGLADEHGWETIAEAAKQLAEQAAAVPRTLSPRYDEDGNEYAPSHSHKGFWTRITAQGDQGVYRLTDTGELEQVATWELEAQERLQAQGH